jgi:hypothetical protein
MAHALDEITRLGPLGAGALAAAALALPGLAGWLWGDGPPGRAAARAWAAEAGVALRDLDEPAFTLAIGGRPVTLSVHPRSGHLRAQISARLPWGEALLTTQPPGGRELADHPGVRLFAIQGDALRAVIDPSGGPPPALPPGLGALLGDLGMPWIQLGPGGAGLSGGRAPDTAEGRRAVEAQLARVVAWLAAAEAPAR